MKIINDTDIDVSWFCFNSTEGSRWSILGGGNLEADGDAFDYEPPSNPGWTYLVIFTRKGGFAQLAQGFATMPGRIVLALNKGKFQCVARAE